MSSIAAAGSAAGHPMSEQRQPAGKAAGSAAHVQDIFWRRSRQIGIESVFFAWRIELVINRRQAGFDIVRARHERLPSSSVEIARSNAYLKR
jgi:hypothetical protein